MRLLSDDRRAAVVRALGIRHWRAELRPNDKVRALESARGRDGVRRTAGHSVRPEAPEKVSPEPLTARTAPRRRQPEEVSSELKSRLAGMVRDGRGQVVWRLWGLAMGPVKCCGRANHRRRGGWCDDGVVPSFEEWGGGSPPRCGAISGAMMESSHLSKNGSRPRSMRSSGAGRILWLGRARTVEPKRRARAVAGSAGVPPVQREGPRPDSPQRSGTSRKRAWCRLAPSVQERGSRSDSLHRLHAGAVRRCEPGNRGAALRTGCAGASRVRTRARSCRQLSDPRSRQSATLSAARWRHSAGAGY